jgi:mannosyltransferase
MTGAETVRVGSRGIDARLVVAAEALLAAVLAMIALGSRSFWLDETVSVTIAQLDWSSFWDVLKTREANLSLYHLLLKGWIGLGESEEVVRALSVVFGVATVPFAYAVARRLVGTRSALLAGLFLAVNPLFVQYSQEARGYALALFLVTVSSYLFVRGIEEPTWPTWVAYGAVAALAAYAHFFALLVPLAHGVSLFVLPASRVPWRRLSAGGAVFALGLLPLFYLLSENEASGIEWAAGNPVGRLFTEIHDRKPLTAAVLVAGVVAVALGWLILRRILGARLRSRETWNWAFLAAWLVVPFVVVAVVAVVHQPLFVIRYFIVCLPPLLILAAALVLRVRPHGLAVVAGTLVVAGSLVATVRWYTSGQAEDWRAATDYVLRASSPEDGAVFYGPYVRIPFTHYLDQAGDRTDAPQPVFPRQPWSEEPITFDYYVPVSARDVARAAAGRDRVWAVLSHVGLTGGSTDEGYEELVKGLEEAGLSAGESEFFPGIEVRRYER